MRKGLWLGAVLALAVTVSSGMLMMGCEQFKPKPPAPPPPADDGDLPNITGKWDLELRTNGTEYVVLPGGLSMTLIQTDDEVEGHWTFGEVDGDVEEDGDVEFRFTSVEPVMFNFEGEVEDDGEEMSGEWTSTLPPPKHEGTWKAERD